MILSDDDALSAQTWAALREGCTCPLAFDGDRYGVARHTCPHCQAWLARLAAVGVSAAPRPVEKMQQPGRRKYRRAA